MVLSHVSHSLAGWPGLAFMSKAKVQESKQKSTSPLTRLAVHYSRPIGHSVPRGQAESVQREEAGKGRG